METSIRNQLYSTCQSAGLPIMSLDTCCRLLAIVYVLGGSMEAFTHNERLISEWKYAQARCNIFGSEKPDAQAVVLIRRYVEELQAYYKNAPRDTASSSPLAKIHPEWVARFMQERYGFKNLWI